MSSIEIIESNHYNRDKIVVEEASMADAFYTPEELAALLKVTRQAIYNWIQQGRLEAVRIGRTVRIPGAEVERLLQEGRMLRRSDQRAEQQP
jgi:excisionase family DNA binding protein